MTTTKGNFSQAPSDALAAAVTKNYVAVHVEQGVPVLDRDLNLLGDLIAAALQQALKAHVGTGVAGTSDFSIATNGNANDFRITAGTVVLNGWNVILGANTSYAALAAAASPSLPALTTPTAAQPNPRIDTVYLDVSQTEVDDSPAPAGDPTLSNTNDVGIRTSTRIQISFAVRVAEGASSAPAPAAGHWFYTLATLSRPTGATVPGSGTPANNTITDARQQTGLNLASLVGQLRSLEKLLAPVVTSFTPTSVVAGQTVPIVVVGKNFVFGNIQVLIGTAAATVDWTTTTSTSLVVEVPYAAAGGSPFVTVPLTVTNELGSATAPSLVTVYPPPVPAFASSNPFTPTSATTGTTITLNGSSFSGVNSVTFNATPPVSIVPSTVTAATVSVEVPSSLQPGAMTITVANTNVTGATATTTTSFTVLSSTPAQVPPTFGTIGSQISPATQVPGAIVTLNGANFGTTSATTTVTFNGTPAIIAPAASVNVTPGQIKVTVPTTLVVPAAPNNKCNITVTVTGESITSNDLLTVA